MPTSDLHPQLERVNARLKAAQLGLVIEQRGTKLNLRGTLPPRPGSSRLRPYQQRIPLGVPATKAGLKQIEQQAKVVAAELIQQTFDWRNYLLATGGKPLAQQELAAKIAAFHQQFLADHRRADRPDAGRTTWEKAYAPYLRKLDAIAQDHPKHTLPELIYTTIKSTRANSRSRQVCCTALTAFANFLNLELPIDPKTFWGTYGNSHTQQRQLPTDEQILAAYEQIPNPNWRFVYGMLATYGLRNHEVFFCDYGPLHQGDGAGVVAVQATTKTGFHEVWPFYPDWIDRFQLRSPSLPPIQTDLNQTTLQRIGQQVSTQFRRYQLPFSPYDLRHAWAVRTIHMGLPDTVSARMMGHSVAVHNRTYHRWITHRDQQQAVDAALRQ